MSASSGSDRSVRRGGSDPAGRGMRADARANQDRIVAAAVALFAEPGADRSTTAIAKKAGVGVGTLYRRFPTREDLIEAVHRRETDRLANSAADLLADLGPVAGLRAWMGEFLTYMATKEGMADALGSILRSHDGLKASSRDLLRTAIAELLAAGKDEGSLRRDFEPDEVMMALGGIALISQHEASPTLGDRLLTLLMDGLSKS